MANSAMNSGGELEQARALAEDRVVARRFAHQAVAGLLREILLDGNIHPHVFERAGHDDFESAAESGAGAGKETCVLLERA